MGAELGGGGRASGASRPPCPPPQPAPPRRPPAPLAAAPAAGAPGGRAAAPSFLAAFWKFLRPHTIRGTLLGSVAVTARALLEQPAPLAALPWAALFPRACLGVLALLAGNGYIVGVNQIYDVEIDAVNKPFLPVAAGELSPGLAWVLVLALAAGGLVVTASTFGPAITALYAFGLFLGTAYSVPPLRLKSHPVPAFLIIATVRGFLLNVGVFSAVRAALGLPFVWSPAALFITCFVTVFATAIAVTKDLPDVEGDAKFGVETFATKLGVARVASLGVGLLAANYVGAAVLAIAKPDAFFRPHFALAAHLALGACLALLRTRLAAAAYSQAAIAAFYRGVWYLFYAEYALLPFL